MRARAASRPTTQFDGTRSTAALLTALAAVALGAGSVTGQERSRVGEGPEQASFDVMGHVVDAGTGTALVGAWVGISDTDWGSLTDDEGRFRIPDRTPGRLALTVEQLGYETREWRGTVTDADDPLILELVPRPVLLEGLEVVTDRFRSRRNAAAVSVFAYDRGDLGTSTARDALEFIEYRSATRVTPCEGRRGDRCLIVRGRAMEPSVYVDEMPVPGGLAYLEALRPWELQMIEVYAGGRHIRAYTPRFMERAAKTRMAPLALPF